MVSEDTACTCKQQFVSLNRLQLHLDQLVASAPSTPSPEHLSGDQKEKEATTQLYLRRSCFDVLPRLKLQHRMHLRTCGHAILELC